MPGFRASSVWLFLTPPGPRAQSLPRLAGSTRQPPKSLVKLQGVPTALTAMQMPGASVPEAAALATWRSAQTQTSQRRTTASDTTEPILQSRVTCITYARAAGGATLKAVPATDLRKPDRHLRTKKSAAQAALHHVRRLAT